MEDGDHKSLASKQLVINPMQKNRVGEAERWEWGYFKLMIKEAFPMTGNMKRDLNKVRAQTKLENKIGKKILILFIPKSSYYLKDIGLLSFHICLYVVL